MITVKTFTGTGSSADVAASDAAMLCNQFLYTSGEILTPAQVMSLKQQTMCLEEFDDGSEDHATWYSSVITLVYIDYDSTPEGREADGN